VYGCVYVFGWIGVGGGWTGGEIVSGRKGGGVIVSIVVYICDFKYPEQSAIHQVQVVCNSIVHNNGKSNAIQQVRSQHSETTK
jgi:hypothetical protein